MRALRERQGRRRPGGFPGRPAEGRGGAQVQGPHGLAAAQHRGPVLLPAAQQREGPVAGLGLQGRPHRVGRLRHRRELGEAGVLLLQAGRVHVRVHPPGRQRAALQPPREEWHVVLQEQIRRQGLRLLPILLRLPAQGGAGHVQAPVRGADNPRMQRPRAPMAERHELVQAGHRLGVPADLVRVLHPLHGVPVQAHQRAHAHDEERTREHLDGEPHARLHHLAARVQRLDGEGPGQVRGHRIREAVPLRAAQQRLQAGPGERRGVLV
mmetsp:Transcript_86637/g.245674  ORF Transcript_86637/g.245674 Transcript_86637/m.245674 type:complete len:267 (+) Transcript_86637:428-1228(+)